MIKLQFFSILLFVLISCGHGKQQDKMDEDFSQVEKKLSNYRFDYVAYGEKSALDSAYALIKSSKYFEKNQLTSTNFGVFFPIYFYLGKYSEMGYLIKQSNKLDNTTHEYYLNLCNAYINYQNGNLGQAKENIKRNVNLIENKLQSNPLDSLYLIDLFKMKLHLGNFDSVMNEVDSLRKNKDNHFSNGFYDGILIPELNEYKMELPNTISEIPAVP